MIIQKNVSRGVITKYVYIAGTKYLKYFFFKYTKKINIFDTCTCIKTTLWLHKMYTLFSKLHKMCAAHSVYSVHSPS